MDILTVTCERCGRIDKEFALRDYDATECWWCQMPKQRGSRKELCAALREATHALYAAAGYIKGISVSDEEQIIDLLRGTIQKVNEA